MNTRVRVLNTGARKAQARNPPNGWRRTTVPAHWRGYHLGVLDGAEPQPPAEAGRAWGTEQGGAYG